jgi:Zn finger protein HypA/HybF involved in hydrogenase expression
MEKYSEADFEIECIRCEEVTHMDALDFYGRCEACQEQLHKEAERPY